MRKVAIIPARSNSRAVPGKNLRMVGGISLVARAIHGAIAAGVFTDVVLTTDGEAIADEGRRAGAVVAWRPAGLAGDNARSVDAACHALESIGVTQGMAVLLQPTSPLRTASDIRQAVAQFEALGRGSLVSVCECEHHPFKTFVYENNEPAPLRELAFMEFPRQLLPLMYRPNGAIYINAVCDLFRENSFFVPPVSFFAMDAVASMDIDSETDLLVANTLIRSR